MARTSHLWKKSAAVIALLSASTILAACGTITRGGTEILTVETAPSGAQVSLSNGMYCKNSPCTFKVSRAEALRVTVTKAGYETATANVASKISGDGAASMAGNVLVGGVIGIGADAVTGSAYSLSPNPLTVSLVESALPDND